MQSKFKYLLLVSTHITCTSQDRFFIVPQKSYIWFYLCNFALITRSSLSGMIYLLLYTCIKQTEFKLHKACNKCSFFHLFLSFSEILYHSLPQPLSWHFALHFYLSFYVWILLLQRACQGFKSRNHVSWLFVFIA